VKRRHIVFIAIFFALTSFAFEQGKIGRYMVQGVTTNSTKQTPFWMLNNRYGLSSLDRYNGYLRAAAFRDVDSTRRFSWGVGADFVVPYNFTSHFVIQQLYGELKYRSLTLTIGSKERFTSVVNRELGSGDMVFSTNARPIPQVYLAMPEYQWIPKMNKWLAVKGFLSLGLFTDGPWQRRTYNFKESWYNKVLYLSKGVFLRGGNSDRFPLTVEGGFEMGTQFGGRSYKYMNGSYTIIDMHHGFKELINAFLGLGGGDSKDPNQKGEISNCYGNHVGEWSLALSWTPKDTDWAARIYFQHYFEDHSQLFWDYLWRDMLLGTEFTLPENPFVDKILYEYLYTKDQSGPVYWDRTPDIPIQISGTDNYYNHSIYGGWQHWGMGMGNPLIVSPVYSNGIHFDHNRVIANHVGISGHPTDELHYRILLSSIRSWGTYGNPTSKVLHNFSSMLEVTYSPRRMSGWSFRAGIAGDKGDIIRNTFGGMFTVTKTGLL